MQEAFDVGDKVAFDSRDLKNAWKKRYIIAGLIVTNFLLCLHGYKAVFKGAYVTPKTILVYGAAFLLFFILMRRERHFYAFQMGADGWSYKGVKHDSKDCVYLFENSTLVLYTMVGEGASAVMPEYQKALEIRVPKQKSEELGKLLENRYTKYNGKAEEKTNPWTAERLIWFCCVNVLCFLIVKRGYIVNEWEMLRENDGIVVTAYNGTAKELVIPDHLEGQEVVGLKDFGGMHYGDVTSVYLPDTIKRISGEHLGFCNLKMEKVTVPASVQITYVHHFSVCNVKSLEIYGDGDATGILKMMELGVSAQNVIFRDCNVPGHMFADMNKSVESVELIGDVSEIGAYAFVNCDALKKVVIPDSVKSIGEGAFWNCTSLSDFVIPNQVEHIGDRAFEGSGVIVLNFPDTIVTFGDDVVKDCRKLSSLRLPSVVQTVSESCLPGNKSLREIEIAEGCTEIAPYAFAECTGLVEVHLPDSLRIIGESAFEGCDGLRYIAIPDSVESIGDRAFALSGLLEITIPGKVSRISRQMFDNCNVLGSVVLSEGVEIIDDEAFRLCTSLSSVEIPDGVKTIGAEAFYFCWGVDEIIVPDSVESIGEAAFQRVPESKVHFPEHLLQYKETAF